MEWVTQKTSQTFLICRRAPARFNLCVEARFPFCKMVWFAHKIRQYMWRALQNLHGFLPAVEINKNTDYLFVRAGGQLICLVNLAHAEEWLLDLLPDPEMRARWLQFVAIKIEAMRC